MNIKNSQPAGIARIRAAHRNEQPDVIERRDVDRILRMIRPTFRKRGGDVQLLDVAGGTVTVELSGAQPDGPIDFDETSGVIDRVVRSRIPQVEVLTVV